MGRIKDYQSTINAPGPAQQRNATAADFGGAIAEGAARLGQGTMDATETVRKNRISRANAKIASEVSQAQAELTIQYKEDLKNADPNDDQFESKWNEKYNARMDLVKAKFQDDSSLPEVGQYLEYREGHLKGHFTQLASEGYKELQATAAAEALDKTIESDSITLRENPQMFGDTLANMSILIDQDTRIPESRKASVKLQAGRKYALNSMQGFILEDHNDAKSRLDKGEFKGYLKAEDYDSLNNRIKQRENDIFQDGQRAEHIKEQARLKIENSVMQGWNEEMEKGTLTFEKITANDQVSAANQRLYQGLLRSEMEGPIKPNVDSYIETVQRVRLPDGHKDKITDSAEIYQLLYDKKLPKSGQYGIDSILQIMVFDKSPEGRMLQRNEKIFMDSVKELYLGADEVTGMRDPERRKEFGDVMAYYHQRVNEMISQKKSPSGLTNPASPDYMGEVLRRESLPNIIKKMSQRLGSNADQQRVPFVLKNPSGGFTNQEPTAMNEEVAVEPTGMTADMREYNMMVRKSGGGSDKLFGANGAMPPGGFDPVAINRLKAAQTAKGKTRANNEAFLANDAKVDRSGMEKAVSREKNKTLKEENEARKLFGLTPVGSLEELAEPMPLSAKPISPEKIYREGEEPGDFIQRMLKEKGKN